LPLFLTYELSDEGGSALVDRLSRALPPHKSKSFIKSFFNATAHPEFAQMVRDSGLRRLVVGGAETDVCVLQTVLGLLDMGIEVYLLRDSVLTNEFNYEPALRRMEQAGAKLILFNDFEKSALSKRAVAAGSHYRMQRHKPSPVAVKPGKIAFVMLDVLSETVDRATHSKKGAILQRLEQALLASYVFDVPFFVLNDPSLEEGLPDGFEFVGGEVNVLDRTSDSAAEVPGLVDGLQERGIEQVVVLGVSQRGSTSRSARDLLSAGFQVFLMEDAILPMVEQLEVEEHRQMTYQSGVIPLTYKSFYYGMTKAADRGDWESQEWLERLKELADKDLLVRVYDLLPWE
jgi:nicotinamidase-related amidase